MTAWSQSYVETLLITGIEPPNLWGVMIWGVDKWGFGGSALPTRIGSVYTDAETITDGLAGQNILSRYVETESPDFTNSNESMGDGVWLYEFKLPTTNAENRDTSSFSCSAAQSDTWTSMTAGSTTWS